jgi:hypothetical protein
MTKSDPTSWTEAFLGQRVTIERVTPFLAEVCRCGTRLVAGVERFRISNPPPSIEYLVKGRGFCSLVCVRAFLLETLAEVDYLASPVSAQAVIDLRSAYLDLNRAISDLGFGVARPI